MAVLDLAQLVGFDLFEHGRVLGLVVLDRDERRHASHSERAALVRGFAEQLGVAVEEVLVHADLLAVRHDPVAVRVERLDAAEDVVPAAAVEADDVVAQLVEDLVHLERGPQRLDEDSGLDRLLRDLQLVLRVDEDLVPQPGLEVRLHLRQVEIRTRAALDQLLRVMEEVQREVDDAARRGLAVDQDVLLFEMPAARTHDQRRDLLVELVLLAVRILEGDLATHRVGQVDLPFHHQVPGRRGGVLEVRHEALRAGVQRVDDHLAIDRPGDLDAAVEQIRRDARDLPLAVADLLGLLEEARQLALVDLLLALDPQLQQLLADRRVLADQLGDELQRLRRQDFLRGRRHCARDLDTFDCAHRVRTPGCWVGAETSRRHGVAADYRAATTRLRPAERPSERASAAAAGRTRGGRRRD